MTQSRNYGARFKRGPLPQIEPPRRPQEYERMSEMAMPRSGFDLWWLDHLENASILSKLRDTPSMWRNLLALYLRAAGVPTAEIAAFLGLGASRVIGLVAKTRKCIAGTPTLGMRAGPFGLVLPSLARREFTKAEVAAHRVRADAMAMREAEAALAHCRRAGNDVVSAALKLGRDRLEERRAALVGGCSCDSCNTPYIDEEALWSHEADTNDESPLAVQPTA